MGINSAPNPSPTMATFRLRWLITTSFALFEWLANSTSVSARGCGREIPRGQRSRPEPDFVLANSVSMIFCRLGSGDFEFRISDLEIRNSKFEIRNSSYPGTLTETAALQGPLGPS